jgi:DNA polymerase-3 subunit gamma/tau
MEVLGESQVAMRDAPDPRVNLEVALVRLAHPEADDSPEAILVRIERLETAGHASSGVPRAAAAVQPEPGGEESPGSTSASAPAQAPAPTPAPRSPSGPASGSGRKTLGAVRRQAGPAPIEKPEATPEPPVADAPTDPGRDLSADAAGSGSEPGSGSFPTRDDLVQAWGDHIIGRLRPKAKALFQAGRFVRVDGDQAVFGLPNEIHRTRCEEVRGEIEAALTDHFGRPVGLALLVDAGAGTGGGSVAGGDDPVPPDPGSSTTSNSRAATAPSPKAGVAGPAPREASPERPDRFKAQPETGQGGEEPGDGEDLSVFDESQLGEVADVDNSAQARVLQAFPGAEEVN